MQMYAYVWSMTHAHVSDSSKKKSLAQQRIKDAALCSKICSGNFFSKQGYKNLLVCVCRHKAATYSILSLNPPTHHYNNPVCVNDTDIHSRKRRLHFIM